MLDQVILENVGPKVNAIFCDGAAINRRL